MIKNTLLLLTVLSLSPGVMAATISGTLEFSKNPPFVGVAYVEGKNSQIAEAVDQVDKKFIKRAYVIKNNSLVTFKNSDSIKHNIYAYTPAADVQFDVGLLDIGQEVSMDISTWKENSIVRIGCKIHPRMKTYVLNVDAESNYVFDFDRKIKKYEFALQTQRSEQATLHLVMPRYDTVALELKAGEPRTVKITKNKKVKGHLTVVLGNK